MRRASAALTALRDWVHRLSEQGPEGLKDSWSKGNPPRLSAAQFAELVETGPDRATNAVVSWRRISATGCR